MIPYVCFVLMYTTSLKADEMETSNDNINQLKILY